MENKRVLITGSGKGIGKAIALKLASQGFIVTLHCRSDIEGAKATASEFAQYNQTPDILQFDIADRQTAKAQLEAYVAEHGHFYGVISNAGVTRDGAFPAMSDDDWDTVIGTNLDGFYNVVQPLVMPMVQSRKGGRIITIASVSGILGNRGQVNYSASKAGLIGATKSLALELAKRKITVNCVAPGLIETDMVADLPKDEILKMVPLRRLGQVNEVAATVAFLMSDEAAYITRQVISVDGGLS